MRLIHPKLSLSARLLSRAMFNVELALVNRDLLGELYFDISLINMYNNSTHFLHCCSAGRIIAAAHGDLLYALSLTEPPVSSR